MFPPLLCLRRRPLAALSLVSLFRKEGVTCAQRPLRPDGETVQGTRSVPAGHAHRPARVSLLAARASACCRPIPGRALAGHDRVSGRGLARPALGVRVRHTRAEAALPHPLQRGCVLGATAAQPHSSVRVPREPWDTGVTSSPPHRSPWPAAGGAAANKSPRPMCSRPARGRQRASRCPEPRRAHGPGCADPAGQGARAAGPPGACERLLNTATGEAPVWVPERDLTEVRAVWGGVSAGAEALGREASGVVQGQLRSRWAGPLGEARRPHQQPGGHLR